jgi:3-dehydroquinate synthase
VCSSDLPERLFAAENRVFADFIQNYGNPTFRKKILFVIDKGVTDIQTKLTAEIVAYFQTHSTADLAPEILVLPGGEVCKNDPRFYEEVIRALDEHGIDRHSFVACIGGGAFLDMAGYAAAISHRGVKFIRIPTTVLSQNDSGVGVKNSVNYLGKKNFLGTFAPPVAVFNDYIFLESLGDRDWRSGIAEAVKVSLIKDINFFSWLESTAEAMNHRDKTVMVEQIYRCASLHMQHIASGDPFEQGSARPLDFGHWAAHKLEYLSDFKIRHGEAVAIGIALDSVYSHLMGYLTKQEVDRIISLLQKLHFLFCT